MQSDDDAEMFRGEEFDLTQHLIDHFHDKDRTTPAIDQRIFFGLPLGPIIKSTKLHHSVVIYNDVDNFNAEIGLQAPGLTLDSKMAQYLKRHYFDYLCDINQKEANYTNPIECPCVGR